MQRALVELVDADGDVLGFRSRECIGVDQAEQVDEDAGSWIDVGIFGQRPWRAFVRARSSSDVVDADPAASRFGFEGARCFGGELDGHTHGSRVGAATELVETTTIVPISGCRVFPMVLPGEIDPGVEIARVPQKLIGSESARCRHTLRPRALGHFEFGPPENCRLRDVVFELPQFSTKDHSVEALEGM